MKKIFAIMACIGFWGATIHPVMIVPFGVGVFGMNKCNKTRK